MINDESNLTSFLVGLFIGFGLALCVVVWKIRQQRRLPALRPSQPVAVLHPLSAILALRKFQ